MEYSRIRILINNILKTLNKLVSVFMRDFSIIIKIKPIGYINPSRYGKNSLL